jgi:hypothetical protein
MNEWVNEWPQDALSSVASEGFESLTKSVYSISIDGDLSYSLYMPSQITVVVSLTLRYVCVSHTHGPDCEISEQTSVQKYFWNIFGVRHGFYDG